ncbi:MAG: SusC/RagA family TonB-linked outer membrane protein [Bacteroidota bacterium]
MKKKAKGKSLTKLSLLFSICVSFLVGFTPLNLFGKNKTNNDVTTWESIRKVDKIDISGTITDETGEPLIGATVQDKSSGMGTVTDLEGKYVLSVTGEDAVLVISYTGYEAKEVVVGQRTIVDIVLKISANKLDEVVVIGYGAVKKEEVTSSIVRLDAEDFIKGNVNSPQQLLQGKVAGLNIARPGSNPNQPFTIRLRGLSTFGANAEPLVIIDGVIGGSINSVDPSDIESINVLKDASAGAIYGTRGSTGVILITTKSGKGIQSSTLEYGGYVAVESISNSIPVANRTQFLENGGTDFGADTDWLDAISRNAISNVHNLSFANSSNGLSYRASINYRDVQGVLNGTGFSQVNARLNANQTLLNDRLKLTGIITVTDRDANIGFDQAQRYALTFNPTAPIFEDRSATSLGRDPNLFGGFFETGVQDVFNPVAINEQNSRTETRKDFLANFKATYELINGLKVSLNYSRQNTNFNRGEFFANNALFAGANVNGIAMREAEGLSSDLFETTATYDGKTNNFRYNVLVGNSFQQFNFDKFSARNTNFITNSVGANNLGLGVGINNAEASVSSLKEEAKLLAYFGRVNLNFNSSAFFSASYRREASSRFGRNNRWGNFWAVSGGVNLNILLGMGSFEQLKVRAGYGVTGNEPAERLPFLERLGIPEGGGLGYANGGFISAISPVSNPNPDLKWEEKGEFSVGIDFITLDSRLSGSIDYFNRKTKDLLNIITVPSPPNIFERTLVNLGELETTGFEAQVNYNLLKQEDLIWEVGANFSTFKSTLIKLNNVESAVEFRGNFGSPGLNNTFVVRVAEGEEIGNIRAAEFAGYNEQGQSMVINQETGEPTTERNLDRDGIVAGNGLPDFSYGVNNYFSYKDFDFNFFLRGVVGHSLLSIQRAYWEHPSLAGKQNFVVTENFNPKDTEQDAFNSSHVEKATFLRLDNATLGYNINLAETSAIRKIRLSVTGNNLLTITDYSGSDPEVRYTDPGPLVEGATGIAFGGDILVPGIDRRVTSLPTRTITFSANITF